MKKLLVAAAALSAAAIFAGGIGANPDAGKLVASGFACAVFDGNGNLFVTYNSEQWAYQTKQVLRCAGNGAPAASLTYFSGFGCNTFYGFTTESVDKVGYNGNSQLTCTTHATSAPSSASGAMGAAG